MRKQIMPGRNTDSTPSEPFVYRRDDDRKRIHVTALRSLTREDFATVLARQVDEKIWTYGVLWDLRRMATVPAAELGEMSDQMVNAIGHLGPRGPVAIVAWSHQVIEGARFYGEAAGGSGLRLQVFSTVADAETWLDEQATD